MARKLAITSLRHDQQHTEQFVGRCAHRSRAAVGASNAKSQPGDAQGHSAWSIEDFSEHAKSTTELLKGVNAALAIVNYSHGVNNFDIDSTEAIHQIPKSTTPPLCD